MIDPPDVNRLDELMGRIRAELIFRPTATDSLSPRQSETHAEQSTLTATPIDPARRRYVIGEFLALHDAVFLSAAYLGVLGREPDPREFEYNLDCLRKRKFSRTELIGAMRSSTEARARDVTIKGLRVRLLIERIKRMRGIRSVIAAAHGARLVYLLPQLQHSPQEIEARLTERASGTDMRVADAERTIQAIKDQANATLAKITTLELRIPGQLKQLASRVSAAETALAVMDKRHAETAPTLVQLADQLSAAETASAALDNRVAETAPALVQLADRLSAAETASAALDNRVAETAPALVQLAADLNSRFAEAAPLGQLTQLATEVAAVRMRLADQWRTAVEQKLRLDLLLAEARRRMPEPFDGTQLSHLAREQDHMLDAFYVGFEDRYRGTRADIKNRQRVYLPHVKAAVTATDGGPVVDIGCGRGEWLELLKEHNIAAKGYDLNRIMVEECLAHGLEVMLGDALEAVRAMPNESLAAVTGFHIIEHLPFTMLVGLFDQCLRVLRPNGIVVFETPNPANLQVAAERFYYDPTHRNPLPSELVAFTAEARGLSRVEILPLHPVEPPVAEECRDPMLELLRQKLFGPQDYGIIAWKDR